MGLRFRPVDTTFYDLFTESAQHLVVGAGLLAEMLSDDRRPRGRRPPHARGRAHAGGSLIRS